MLTVGVQFNKNRLHYLHCPQGGLIVSVSILGNKMSPSLMTQGCLMPLFMLICLDLNVNLEILVRPADSRGSFFEFFFNKQDFPQMM